MDEVKRLGKWNGNNVELMGGGYLMSMNVYQELKCNVREYCALRKTCRS